MGCYYALHNLTKKQSISGYWKAYPFCDVHAVMHQFGWESTDIIISVSAENFYYFKYDGATQTMVFVEDGELNDRPTELPDTSDAEDCLQMGFSLEEFEACTVGNDGSPLDVNHVPQWQNKTCECCGFKFEETVKMTAVSKFNPLFFGN